jgi:hypothetical protein
MGESGPVLEKREIRLPDGRRLVYYRFPPEEPHASRAEGDPDPTASGARAGKER